MNSVDPLFWLSQNGARFVEVKQKSKNPIHEGWQHKPRTFDQIRPHLKRGGNVGMVAGLHSSGLCAWDIDRDFEKFIATFPQFADTPRIIRPDAPSRGKVLIKIKGDIPAPRKWKPIPHDSPWAEWLATGNQALIPPSIHPTGTPFELINCENPIPTLTAKEMDALWRKWTSTDLVERSVTSSTTVSTKSTDKTEWDTFKADVRARFDMVKYACQELNTTARKENADEVRVLGQGGLLINVRLRVWNTFGDGKGDGKVGGDCFKLIAFLTYGRTDAPREEWIEVLKIASTFTGVDLPERKAKEDGNAASASVVELVSTEGEVYQPAAAPSSPATIQVVSARDVLTMHLPDPIWAVPGLLPVGLTLLAGRQKLGKSWLALQISKAIAAGGETLGTNVKQGRVLYMALEDNWRRLKSRMVAQKWEVESADNCDFLTLTEFMDSVGDLRKEGGKRLAAAIQANGYDVVFIDTLSRAVWGSQSDVDEMTRWLSPIQSIAFETETAIVLIDHHRKSMTDNPDVIADVLGSQAKAAVADTIWGFYRERGKQGAKLSITGRDVEEKTYALHWDGFSAQWMMDGDAEEIELSENRQAVVQVINTHGGRATMKQILDATGQDKGNLYRLLQEMTAAHQLQQIGAGRGLLYQVSSRNEDTEMPGADDNYDYEF